MNPSTVGPTSGPGERPIPSIESARRVEGPSRGRGGTVIRLAPLLFPHIPALCPPLR